MFDTRLKELRTGAGLTQAQLAKQLGVTQSTIGNWESGCRVPAPKLRAKVAAFFGVSTDYLLGEDSPVSFGPDGESMPDIYFRLAQGAKALDLTQHDVDLLLGIAGRSRTKRKSSKKGMSGHRKLCHQSPALPPGRRNPAGAWIYCAL